MKDLENKLQFIITLSLFFPVLLYAIFDNKGASQATLKWGTVVIFLIFNYLYLNLLKSELPKKIIKWLDILLDINIVFFIPLIFSFSFQIKYIIITKILLFLGSWGVLLVPITILLLLFCYTIFTSFPKFFKKIWNYRKIIKIDPTK